MTINSPEAFIASLWNWQILAGCFGDSKISPTDVDGGVERRGWCLALETKLPGVEIKPAQMSFYKALVETGRFTVILIWGKPGRPEKIVVMTRFTTREYAIADIKVLRQIITRWYEFANTTKMVPPKFGAS